MYKTVALATALSLAGSAAASPHLVDRAVANPVCARDNLLRCFLDPRYDAQVSAYCNDLPTFTTTVATVTATSYETEYSTITASTQTDTVRITTTVFTNTVPSSTQTVTKQVPPLKRDARAAAPPPCATNYPASRITSACSCISVAAPTESVTYTISTETITTTLPSLVTATVTESTTEVVLAEKTQGVKVVEVDYPVHVYNGGFDLTPARGWTWTVSNSAQLQGYSAFIGSAVTQAWILAFRSPVGVSARLTNQLPLKLLPGKRYKLSFGSTINSGDLGTALSLNLQAPSAGQFFHMKALGGTPYRNNWFRFEGYLTYPANWPVQETTLYMNVNPFTYGGGYTVYVDDIRIEEVV